MTVDQAKHVRDVLKWIEYEEAQEKVILKLLKDALNGDQKAIEKLAEVALNLQEFKLDAYKQRLADL